MKKEELVEKTKNRVMQEDEISNKVDVLEEQLVNYYAELTTLRQSKASIYSILPLGRYKLRLRVEVTAAPPFNTTFYVAEIEAKDDLGYYSQVQWGSQFFSLIAKTTQEELRGFQETKSKLDQWERGEISWPFPMLTDKEFYGL